MSGSRKAKPAIQDFPESWSIASWSARTFRAGPFFYGAHDYIAIEDCLKLLRREKTVSQQQTTQLPAAEAVSLAELVTYQPGGIVSKTLIRNDAGNLTLFAFDAGQGLSEHIAPYEAIVQVLEGQGEFTIAGKTIGAAAGQTVLMPAHAPHSVQAPEKFKMLLIMIRG
jgi:quercetin dioxygenase-like cupin family protein